jgi:YHS domain-containing protein
MGRGPGGARRPRGGEIRGEELVRDRVCQTYLPRSRALRTVDPDGSEHFFCSEECRAKYAAGER